MEQSGLDGRFWQLQLDSPRARSRRRVTLESENVGSKRKEKRSRPQQERQDQDEVATPLSQPLVSADLFLEVGAAPKSEPQKKFKGLREIQRLSAVSFDGKYWTSPVSRPSATSSPSARAAASASSSSSSSPVSKSVISFSASISSSEDSRRPSKPSPPSWLSVAKPLVEEKPPQQMKDESSEEGIVAEDEAKAVPTFSGNDGASYLHSEAARLYEARKVGTIIVPDLNGQISMDGDYWKISESGRSRRQRELQFFPASLKLGSTSSSSLPRAPPSPRTLARRRQAQQAAAAELRAEREQRDAEYAALVRFESSGREIVPQLFLGGVVAAENTAWVSGAVDFVVNVSGKTQPYAQVLAPECILRIDEADNEHANLFQHFVPVADRIAELIQAGRRVLVHCYQGKSRSAALVASYLVLKHNMALSDALSLIVEKNRGHKINPGFMSQLEKLECLHNGLQNSSVFQHKDTRRQ